MKQYDRAITTSPTSHVAFSERNVTNLDPIIRVKVKALDRGSFTLSIDASEEVEAAVAGDVA